MPELRTFRVIDRGYDCDQFGKPWDITAATMLEAVRMLDGFARADYLTPINSVKGCHTYAVYTTGLRPHGRGRRSDAGTLNKIGVVSISQERP